MEQQDGNINNSSVAALYFYIIRAYGGMIKDATAKLPGFVYIDKGTMGDFSTEAENYIEKHREIQS